MDAKKARVKLDLGGVTLWVPETEISSQKQQGSMRSASIYRQETSRSLASGRLDLRGMRTDEAVSALQQHMDQAVLQGRKEVAIIHGRGTGVLRKAVHEELARFPEVAEYSLANEEQGGDGVTIARLGQ